MGKDSKHGRIFPSVYLARKNVIRTQGQVTNSQWVNTGRKKSLRKFRIQWREQETAAPHPNLTGLMSQMATGNKVSKNFKREWNSMAAGVRFTEKQPGEQRDSGRCCCHEENSDLCCRELFSTSTQLVLFSVSSKNFDLLAFILWWEWPPTYPTKFKNLIKNK